MAKNVLIRHRNYYKKTYTDITIHYFLEEKKSKSRGKSHSSSLLKSSHILRFHLYSAKSGESGNNRNSKIQNNETEPYNIIYAI